MVNHDGNIIDQYPESAETNETIRRLRQDILHGLHWYIALLHAIGRWETIEETVNGHDFRYLISDEAFDYLKLAERLCGSVSTIIPSDEMDALLFHNITPIELTYEEFKGYIGDIKYHQHLNFYYGIVVEEALISAVEEEIRKERWATGLYRDKDNTDEAFSRIYNHTKTDMLKDFRKEKGYPQKKSIKLDELKEFTYWLFKHRLKQSDKARVASDTKKGLDWLSAKGSTRQTPAYEDNIEAIDILSYR